jgi:hypothetical protein
LIVPSVFETRFAATTFTRPALAIASRPSKRSSPESSIPIARNSAPVRFAICCHGTKFAWCSSSVTTATSPGPRLSSPQAYATRFSACVTLRVKITSLVVGALISARVFSRAAS